MKINYLDFILSSISEENDFEDTKSILKWIEDLKNKVKFSIKQKSLSELENWKYPKRESIYHKNKSFFSINGFSGSSTYKQIPNDDQPLIIQDEVGILGFIVKKINGVLFFLVQAKIEPGNINIIQLSPTLQATVSNYLLKHGGSEPDYMHYFLDASEENILYDQLLSEEGTRFLKKRNRNMIIFVKEEIKVKDNYKWMTLKQIKCLMQFDNTVNRCARSVISLIRYDFDLENSNLKSIIYKKIFDKSSIFLNSLSGLYKAKNSIEYITQYIKIYKAKNMQKIKKIALHEMGNWETKADEIIPHNKEEFKIIGVSANISIREVKEWDQPMIQPRRNAIFGVICKFFENNLHFLVKVEGELGTFDGVELSPTVKVYKFDDELNNPYFEYLIKAKEKYKLIDSLQSEEGGRFFKEQNRNLIVLADENFSEEVHPGYIWIDLYQLSFFNQFNNMLNIHLRNFLALVPNHK